MSGLERFLSDDYCLRCDSFGNVDHRHLSGSPWCNTCWERAQPLPRGLRAALTEAHARLTVSR